MLSAGVILLFILVMIFIKKDDKHDKELRKKQIYEINMEEAKRIHEKQQHKKDISKFEQKLHETGKIYKEIKKYDADRNLRIIEQNEKNFKKAKKIIINCDKFLQKINMNKLIITYENYKNFINNMFKNENINFYNTEFSIYVLEKLLITINTSKVIFISENGKNELSESINILIKIYSSLDKFKEIPSIKDSILRTIEITFQNI